MYLFSRGIAHAHKSVLVRPLLPRFFVGCIVDHLSAAWHEDYIAWNIKTISALLPSIIAPSFAFMMNL